MSIIFQYVPMNAIGILGNETDVLKTGGVGTCIVLFIKYKKKYALAHVPYDSDSLFLKKQEGVNVYVSTLYEFINKPEKNMVKVTIIQNDFGLSGKNELATMIKKSLTKIGLTNFKYERYRTDKRMSVVVLKNKSVTNGRYFCYQSNKTEFVDECEFADYANNVNSNIIAKLDPKKRNEKHHFRRHADLYAKARRSLGIMYSQKDNSYTKSLINCKLKGDQFLPYLADANIFSREKTKRWTKKSAKPFAFSNYLEWENTIKNRVLKKISHEL